MKRELTENILPYWMNKMQDGEHGGFYGRIDGNEVLHPYANKGAIMNARILWTFAAAYRLLGNEEYRVVACRAFDYIKAHFIDNLHGGAFWELDYQGNPVNTKKQTYVQGFMLYAFSEYYRATGDAESLRLAKDFFYLIERCFDKEQGGYFEACSRNWLPIDDMRLSEKDANEKKTMNTHLHILEPYTNLCRIWDNDELKAAQKRLIRIFIDKIVDRQSNHLQLFFDETWHVKSSAISYGHDIEASWLLFEAAEELGDKELSDEVKIISLKIAAAAAEGLMPDGSLLYERNNEHIDRERHWWVQAEAVVGFMYAYRNSGNDAYRQKSLRVWEYIRTYIIDRTNGEWHWSRLEDGTVNRSDDKAGFWKCPYHNGRMCLEMMDLTQENHMESRRQFGTY
ncbi:MAG: AGE family epimerase/isomerase [Candidatus Symbiothrix sp.]|jgi:mannobiose 2-epimerase|nr:AGE family epimerase/isomerase [Candidatus Symbiothrix sp.]